jgi:hypothetical protein
VIVLHNEPKVLIPIPKFDWRTRSAAQPKDQFGRENQTRFRIRAKTHDGIVLWTGWFDDRFDFDAFIYSVAMGTIHQEPSLWRLCSPMWPGLDPNLVYDFATVSYLTSGAGSLQTYTKPADWREINGIVETLGAGGSGGRVYHFTGSTSTGGGGGAWNKTTNVVPSGSESYQIGLGGATTSQTTMLGIDGEYTWFGGATIIEAITAPVGGWGGKYSTTSGAVGGIGGIGSIGIGTSSNDGGSGGTTSVVATVSGGGGAAGPSGNGGNAPNVSSTGAAAGNGGTSDTGLAGGIGSYSTIGDATATDGSNGTDWDASHGSGSGGGGARSGVGGRTQAGNGGNYGGGGGGVGNAGGGTGSLYNGDGAQGMIVLTYTPSKLSGFNSPMLGM